MSPPPQIKPSLADLRAFVTVGELQSFVAAAELLHLSQPALSRRIANLERVLNVRLLDRTTRSVELTPLGRRFLGKVRSAIAELDHSVVDLGDVAHIEAGDVTVGCVFLAVSHFLLGVIERFREAHPHVMVRVIEEGADEVLACVKSGEAEIALNYVGMQDPEVEFTPLLKDRFLLACRVDHPLARRRSVRWDEVVKHPYALVSHASRNRVLIDQALADVADLPRPICEFRHASTLIGFVDQGLGVAVVPQLAVPRPSASIVGIPIEHPVYRTIGVTRRRGRSLSPAAEAFEHLLMAASRAADKPRRSA